MLENDSLVQRAPPTSFLLSPSSNKLFLLAAASAAVIGLAIHASLTFKPNFSGVVYPQARSCLMTASLLFFSLHGLLLQFRYLSCLPRAHFSGVLVTASQPPRCSATSQVHSRGSHPHRRAVLRHFRLAFPRECQRPEGRRLSVVHRSAFRCHR